MKKILVALTLALLLAVLLPTTIQAASPDCYSCCCEGISYWFKVSYFEKVWNEDIGMWSHQWVTEYVEVFAENPKVALSDRAAKTLGLKAGYNCFVTRAIGYQG